MRVGPARAEPGESGGVPARCAARRAEAVALGGGLASMLPRCQEFGIEPAWPAAAGPTRSLVTGGLSSIDGEPARISHELARDSGKANPG